jgi:hypothetical protein
MIAFLVHEQAYSSWNPDRVTHFSWDRPALGPQWSLQDPMPRAQGLLLEALHWALGRR